MSPVFGALVLIFMLLVNGIESSNVPKNLKKLKMRNPFSSQDDEGARRTPRNATPIRQEEIWKTRFGNPKNKNTSVKPAGQKSDRAYREGFSHGSLAPNYFHDYERLTREKDHEDAQSLKHYETHYPDYKHTPYAQNPPGISLGPSRVIRPKHFQDKERLTSEKEYEDEQSLKHYEIHYPDYKHTPFAQNPLDSPSGSSRMFRAKHFHDKQRLTEEK